MKNALENASGWAWEAGRQPLPEWEGLPGIPLYMDQVVLYLADLLAAFQREENAPLLTSSMVNNYVKNGAVLRPEKKKYGRRQLAALAVLCLLKQVLPLQDIKALFAGDVSQEELYGLFREVHHAAMEEAGRELEQSAQEGRDPRREALRLAAEANAKRAAAQRILLELEKEASSPKEKAGLEEGRQ